MNNNLQNIWTLNIDGRGTTNGINLCGSSMIDPAIGVNVDVTFKHSGNELTLVYGSTLKVDPCSASFGVSNVEVLVL